MRIDGEFAQRRIVGNFKLSVDRSELAAFQFRGVENFAFRVANRDRHFDVFGGNLVAHGFAVFGRIEYSLCENLAKKHRLRRAINRPVGVGINLEFVAVVAVTAPITITAAGDGITVADPREGLRLRIGNVRAAHQFFVEKAVAVGRAARDIGFAVSLIIGFFDHDVCTHNRRATLRIGGVNHRAVAVAFLKQNQVGENDDSRHANAAAFRDQQICAAIFQGRLDGFAHALVIVFVARRHVPGRDRFSRSLNRSIERAKVFGEVAEIVARVREFVGAREEVFKLN